MSKMKTGTCQTHGSTPSTRWWVETEGPRPRMGVFRSATARDKYIANKSGYEFDDFVAWSSRSSVMSWYQNFHEDTEPNVRTGTATVLPSSETRYFVEDAIGTREYFRRKLDRDEVAYRLKTGPDGVLQTFASPTASGRDLPESRRDYYHDLKYDNEGVKMTDYEQKYKDLVKALESEANARNWCAEWKTFAKANGIELYIDKNTQVRNELSLGSIIRFGKEDSTWIKTSSGWRNTITSAQMTADDQYLSDKVQHVVYRATGRAS